MKYKFIHPEPKEDDIVGPKYWKSLDEAADTPEFRQWLEREFPAGASEIEGVNRRHFLKIMAASFSFAGLGLAGCRQDEKHMLPYAKQPERNVPGVPLYYATSMPRSRGNIPLIVETQDSRPTKIEGNPSDEFYNGATDAFAQASILDLYDPDRATKSLNADKEPISKEEVEALFQKINEKYAAKKGAGLAILSEKSTSPTRDRFVAELKKLYPELIWAEYEPLNYDNPLKALQAQFGKSLRPWHHFEKAKRILSVGSDFLGMESGHLASAYGFSKTRKVKSTADVEKMSRLYMVEADFTPTGGMADHRLRLETANHAAFLCAIGAEILRQTGGSKALISSLEQKSQGLNVDPAWIKQCADDLVAHKGEALVAVAASLPEEMHVLAMALNTHLGANGKTISYTEVPVTDAQSIDILAEAVKGKKVETLVIMGGNPAYNAPAKLDWANLKSSVPEVIRYGYYFDETSEVSNYHIAANHYLESWSDGRTWEGAYVPVQPMILPLFDGFSELEMLAKLLAKKDFDPYASVKETFINLYPGKNFDEWLSVGVVKDESFKPEDIKVDVAKVEKAVADAKIKPASFTVENLDLQLTPSRQVFDGRYNNNGWLQEMPDPMTKLTWDNAILISPTLADALTEKFGYALLPKPSLMNEMGQANINAAHFDAGKEEAYIAELTVDGQTIRGPLHIQPGLADYAVVVPLGYGRKTVGRVGMGSGFDAYPLMASTDTNAIRSAALKVTSDRYSLANTQEHWSMEGRALLREASAEDYKHNPDFVKKMGLESHSPSIYGTASGDSAKVKATQIPRGGSAYKTPDFKGPQQWGMSIDLNTCTGCSACVVACQSENNIAIVGKDQVLRGREMHWMRLDRYFSSGKDDKTVLPTDPQVSFMSMLCQHCELAPCENVCPVNATVHDEEGLNVMAYNRCVGTRYCANNCPYKVRRFNFFDWNKREIGHFYEGPTGPAGMPELHKMQKNPDVTVRMRGVMEKCTFCVQRIEEAKINQRVKAKDSDNILVPDGTIQTACQQVCPTDSIVFGDVADPTSAVAQAKDSELNYSVLGYLNTRPRTTYLARIRNPNPLMPDFHDQPLSRLEYEKRYGHAASHEEMAAAH